MIIFHTSIQITNIFSPLYQNKIKMNYINLLLHNCYVNKLKYLLYNIVIMSVNHKSHNLKTDIKDFI